MSGGAREPGRTVTSRVLTILGAFDETHQRLTLSDLSRRSGLPLRTAVRLGIPATFVVVNNGTLAFEYHLQKYVEKNVIAAINDFSDRDYGAIARTLGADGVLVRSRAELDDALAAALRSDAPTLIDARVDREAIAPVTSYAAQGIDTSVI